jgi:hypothetical protein
MLDVFRLLQPAGLAMHGVREAAQDMGVGVETATDDAATGMKFMADASKDDLHVVQTDLEDTGVAAEEMGSAATRGANDFRTAVRSTLDSVAALRAGITGDAAAVASALFDPMIAQLELVELQEELRANRKAQRDSETTAEEQTQLKLREQNILKSMIEQNALLLTYGTEAEQISKTKAFLTSDWWRQAYEGATPEQRDALDAWKLTLQGRLDAMEGSAREGGGDLRDGYIGELNKGGPGVQSAINSWSSAAQSAFDKAKAAALAAGKGTGAAYAAGLRASWGLVNDAAYYVGTAIGPLKPSSPPPAVPWIIDAGATLGEMWAQGIASAQGAVGDASRVLASGLALPFTAPMSGALPLAYAGAESGAAPRSGNEYHVHIDGLIKATDPFEVATQMERFQQTGVLPPPEDEYR